MPWLAVPLTEQETQMRIWKELKMFTVPSIVIDDASGKILCKIDTNSLKNVEQEQNHTLLLRKGSKRLRSKKRLQGKSSP